MNKKQRNLLITLIILVVIGSLVFFLFPRTQLSLAIAPSPLNIKIDSGATQRVKNGDKVSVSPGDHTITVSEDQFTSYTTKITIKFGETQELLVALTPTTDVAQQRLNDDVSQAIVQRFHGKTMSSQTDQLSKDYPILSILPITARFYRIYPCPSQKYPNDSTKIAVCVDTNQDGIQPYVEKDLASRGFNASDYEMIYTPVQGD